MVFDDSDSIRVYVYVSIFEKDIIKRDDKYGWSDDIDDIIYDLVCDDKSVD